jgi:hypothetical protein
MLYFHIAVGTGEINALVDNTVPPFVEFLENTAVLVEIIDVFIHFLEEIILTPFDDRHTASLRKKETFVC